MKKKIAIIIPAYKATFLRTTLDALARQECQEFTVYIGDDASPHRLKDIVESYTEQLEIVYHRFPENLGRKDLTSHWQRCIDLSHEPVVWFFSDDDTMPPDAVRRLADALDRYGEKGVFFRFPLAVVDAEGNVIKENPPLAEGRTSGYGFLLEKMGLGVSSAACEYAFSRDVWRQAGGFVSFPLAWCSDDATWATLADCAGGIIPLPGAPVCWRNAEGENICNSAGLDGEKLKATALFLDWCCARYRVHLKEGRFRKAILVYVKTVLKHSVGSRYSARELWHLCRRIGKHRPSLAVRIALKHIWKIKRLS